MKSNTRLERNKRGIKCLNCQQPLSSKDNFCSNCGQVNDLKPLSINQYLTEFLAGFFSFDTRTLNTIVPILFKPGKVTNQYVGGHRMKYVNPFQLYLHTSIIFFLITGVFSSIDGYKKIINTKVKNEFTTKQADSIKNKIKEDLKKKGINVNGFGLDLSSEKDSLTTNINYKNLIISKSDSLFNEAKFLNTVNNKTLTIKDKDVIINELINTSVSKLYLKFRKVASLKKDSLRKMENINTVFISNLNTKLTANKIDYQASNFSKMSNKEQIISKLFGKQFYKKYAKFKKCKTKDIGKALDSLGYERSRKNIFLFKKTKEFNKLADDKESRRTFFKNYISKIPIVLFFLLPVFALLLKLIYIRRKYNYTEHLVFIFHIQTFFFLNLLFAIILDRIIKTDIFIGISSLIFAIYLFIALLKYYKQGWFKTLIKYFILNFGVFILSIIGLLIVGLLTFVM